MIHDLEQQFSILRDKPDQSIDLAKQALLIASYEYPEVNIVDYLERLDDYAEQIQSQVGCTDDVTEKLSILNNHLFDVIGFQGNLLEFKDPKNSYLNIVIERKLGIPITLSLVYIEVGRRLGLDLYGVSFPGHFLVRLNTNDDFFIIDPFAKGIILDNKELTSRLSHFPQFRIMNWTLSEYLQATSNMEFLSRMLRNLKLIFQEQQDPGRGLNTLNLLLALNPDSAIDYYDRAGIFEVLDCALAASHDLERYLQLQPESEHWQDIMQRIHSLRSGSQELH